MEKKKAAYIQPEVRTVDGIFLCQSPTGIVTHSTTQLSSNDEEMPEPELDGARFEEFDWNDYEEE